MAAVVKLFRDGMSNFLAGFGVPGRDKAASQRFVLEVIDQQQLVEAYRGDWLCRKIVDIPAFDSCRAWRQWQAENEEIEDLEEAEKALGLQRKLMQALMRARLFGGAAMIIGIDGQKFDEELDPESVKKDSLKFVHVVTRYEIEAGPVLRDITSPWYGEPSHYKRVNSVIAQPEKLKPPLEESSLGYKPGDTLVIHPSRVVRLVGLDYPDLVSAPDPWGDSALQPVVDAIRAAGLVNSSIASMVAEAKLDVVKVPGLLEMLATEAGANTLRERFSFAMAAKSTVNTTLIDGNEEWERINLAFSNMDQVMGMYLNVAAGAADIPATRLLGREPAGMNATGDSDIRNYYDRLQSDQMVRLTPALARLDEVLIRHALGDRPDEVHYEWKPLWQMDDAQKSEIWLRKAQAHQIDVNSGLINPDVLREVRFNQCVEDGFYPGLEAAREEFDIEPDDDEHDLMALKQGEMELQHGKLGLQQGKLSMQEQREKIRGMKKQNSQPLPKPNGSKAPPRG